MEPSSTETQREKLEAWLRYYEDLGLGSFYKGRRHAAIRPAKPAREAAPAPVPTVESPAPSAPAVSTAVRPRMPVAPARQAASPPAAAPPLLPVLDAPSLFDAADRVENDTLERIREDLGECTRCRLHQQRNKIVFGDGSPRAELVFVGEGPGHDEDVQGLPFVGRAGKLLTEMIEAMGLRRADVYICNVVKCRPPDNRRPEDDEVATCSPFLYRQLDAIRPKAIVCLGATAAQSLLKTKESVSKYRGNWFDYRGTKLMLTYHPAYLLRNPNAKGDVWKDLQKVMAFLGLKGKRAPR
jgi:uracil-DNA glycosylase family 4